MIQRTLPTFERPEPEDPEEAARWRRQFWKNWYTLEREHGRGPTYPEAWRVAILDGIVPEWVFSGIQKGGNSKLRERCRLAYLALERLHKDLENER